MIKDIKMSVIPLLFVSAGLLCGCTPATTVRKDGNTVKHYFGYVRVIEPPVAGARAQFNVSELETIGLRVTKGVGLGYFHERSEYIPLDCRLVIRVANKEELDRTLEILQKIPKEEFGLCALVDTGW